MCNVCGCGQAEVRIDERQEPAHADAGRGHHHDHDHSHAADGALNFGSGPAGASVPGQDQSRLVRIEQDVLARNDAIARGNRERLAKSGSLALNLVSSPGAGKTTLLVATIEQLGANRTLVIEGDQETSADAELIRTTGVPAVQVNTGKGCHLDAAMVSTALDHLPDPAGRTVLIENVGNLVCPAGFDLGEAHKVVIASVTEGEDKPLKYPGMFAAADLMLVAKTDLLPYLDFDVEQLITNARRTNPDIEVIRVSARSGEGMEAWLAWIEAARGGASSQI